MNKILSFIYNNKKNWIKFLGYSFDTITSIISIYLIPNKYLSILFVMGIFFINIIIIYVLDDKIKHFKFERFLNKNVKRIYFCSLFGLALAPLLMGFFFEGADFIKLFFSNTLPNILGFFIVYSFVDHISKFHYSNFVIKILKTDYVIGLILKIFYYVCFFNSVSFFLNKSWQYTNIVNNIYLFIVIMSGAIVGLSFFYRMFIDDEPFNFSPKKVFPTKTLYCGAAFLSSCSLPSYFFEVEIAPILLILNTLTTFVVGLTFFHFAIRKGNKNFDDYPFFEFGSFSLIIILNCCFYIARNIEDLGNILYQFICGGGILLAVIIAICILNVHVKKQDDKKNNNSDSPS